MDPHHPAATPGDETAPGEGPAGIRKSATGFVGSAAALGLGTAMAQAVTILISPILSRLFEPDAFGLAALFGSVTMTIGLVGCVSYQLAILLPGDDRTAANLFGLSLLLTVVVTLLAALAVGLGGEALLGLVNARELAPYKWLIPAGVFLTAVILPLRYWNSRHNHFKRLGLTKAGASLVKAAVVLGIGFLGHTAGVHLIVARMAGKTANPLILGWRFLRDDLPYCLRHWTWSGMWQAAKRYKKFPLITSWTQLLNVVSRQAPVVLIAAFFGPAAAGLYALGRRVLHLPGNLVATSISQVFFQRGAVKRASGQDLASLVRNVATRLVTVGLLPMLIVGMVGPDLFGFVFGENWREAGLYASILAPWLFVMFVSSPLSPVLMILERQGLQLLMNVGLALVLIGALVAGGLVTGRAFWTLVLFSAGGAAYKMFVFSVYVRLSKAHLGRILVHLLRQVLYAGPTAGILALVKWGLGLDPLYVFIAAIGAAVPYIVIAFRQDAQLPSTLKKAIQKAGGRKD